jgi:hypothetical protein
LATVFFVEKLSEFFQLPKLINFTLTYVDSAAIPQFIAFLAKTLCGGKKADENLWLSSWRVVNRNG